MAQDFYTAFGLGDSERHITTIDADGVALASIQALYERSQALETENTALQRRVDDLEARVAALEHPTQAGLSAGAGVLLTSLVIGLLVRRGDILNLPCRGNRWTADKRMNGVSEASAYPLSSVAADRNRISRR
jgi:hypothetical protein